MTIDLRIHRADLLPALAAASRLLERRNTIPILSNVRLDASGSTLKVTATDLDMLLTFEAQLSAIGQACVTIPGTLFHDFVRKLPDDAVITIAGDAANVTISAGRSRVKLPTLPADDFPMMDSGQAGTDFRMTSTAMLVLLATTQFAISTEETRYYLNGVFLHAPDEVLRAVATDGHRLAWAETPLPEGAAGMPSVIIPRKTVDQIQKLFGDKSKGDEKLDMSVSDNRIIIARDDVRLVSKLVDGTYPDYQRVVPTGNPNRFAVQKDALVKALDRVTILSGDKSRATKLEFGDGTLKLSAANPDLGNAEEELSCKLEAGEQVEIGFNGRYVLDMLGTLFGDTATFHLGDAGAPALVTGADPNARFVLMPMRV